MSGPARCEDRILICAGPVTLLCRKITAIRGGTCIKGLRRAAQFRQRIQVWILLLPGRRPGILSRTAAAIRRKAGRIFPGVTAFAKADSRIPAQ